MEHLAGEQGGCREAALGLVVKHFTRGDGTADRSLALKGCVQAPGIDWLVATNSAKPMPLSWAIRDLSFGTVGCRRGFPEDLTLAAASWGT